MSDDALGPDRRPDHLFIYCDGGASGNPGPAGAAALLKDAEGDTLMQKARAFGPATNNVAEYTGLILGLEMAAQLRPRRLTIRSDSELMVRQLAGRYKVKSPGLKPLYQQVRRMIAGFDEVEIEHIPRELNAEADKLAKAAVEKAREVAKQSSPKDPHAQKSDRFRLK